MNNFTFYSPTLFAFGEGEEHTTGALVRRFGGSKVLLVYGGGSVKSNGAYDAVTASLRESGLPYCELSGVQANPRSGKVYEGLCNLGMGNLPGKKDYNDLLVLCSCF